MKKLLSLISPSLFLTVKHPDNPIFKKGQKVFCHITHEVPHSKITQGEVVGFAFYKDSYWGRADIKEWYIVKYKSGRKIVLPHGVMCDLHEYIKREENYFKQVRDLGVMGQKGFGYSAYNTLNNQLNDCKNFQ